MANIEFWEWVDQEINRRGLSYHRIERESGLSNATVSKPARNRSDPSVTVCRAIARAFGIELESVYRRAGLLPALPAEVVEEREALTLFRSLGRDVRHVILTTMRNLLGRPGPVARQEVPHPEGDPDTPRTFSERLAWNLARQLEGMPPEDQQKVFDFMKRIRGDREGDGESEGVPLEPGG